MNKLHYLFLIILLSCLIACDDIFTEDISDDSVTLIAPGEGVNLKSNEITLAWEALEGAEDYLIVVVSPKFDNVFSYICDSITDQCKMKVTLNSGQYEWSVQARNSAYESIKSIRNFEISNP